MRSEECPTSSLLNNECSKIYFTEVNSMQKLYVHNGKVWEKSELHLKSAIPKFSRFNVVKQIELDLLKELCG